MRKYLVVLPLVLAFTSSAFAVNASISKSARPGNIYGTAPFYSYATFGVTSVNFPSGTLNLTKTITSVQYSWQHYSNGTTDKVELCYDKPYKRIYEYCFDITSSQTGTSTALNSLQFDAGSNFYIKHTVSGPTSPKIPSLTNDQITVNYSY